MKTGAELIAEERIRQIEKEGWSAEHDDEEHGGGAGLVRAAIYYAMEEADVPDDDDLNLLPFAWPWSEQWWKPEDEDPIRNLTKAGALIAAEIDRLNRNV